MLPTPETITKLRKMLNEVIPASGTEADTNFTDSELSDLLAPADNIYVAASLGWTLKAGFLKERIEKYQVGQENYTETSLKDALDFSLKMAAQYTALAENSKITGQPQSGIILKVKPPEVL